MSWEREVIGDCTLYRGDAREILPLLPTLDALVTDPPYGVNLRGKRGHYRYEPNAQRQETYLSYEDTPENFETLVLPILRKALENTGCAAVFMESHKLWQLPPGDLGGIYLPHGCGRGSWGFQNFMHVIFYGHDPYLAAGRGCMPNGRYGLWGNDANTIAHPCAKPLAAMCWAVQRVSFAGHHLLDPFMGSGTTGVACVELGRSFTGIEIEQRYFDLACQRIEAATRQGVLFPPAQRSKPTQEVLL